jgi:ADP-ribosylglycohydrolase
MTICNDKVRGVLYGQAIGDALGIQDEGKSATQLLAKYGPMDTTLVYRDSEPFKGSVFKAGEWSDDTALALALLDAHLAQGKLEFTRKAAYNFREWLKEDGRGSGRTIRNVICDAGFLINPHDAAMRIWLRGHKQAAPNGAVMRTSVMGLTIPTDLDYVEQMAVDGAKITHYDPRCIASSVAVSCAIAVLVTGGDVATAMDVAVSRATKYHAEVGEWTNKSLDELDLDEGLDENRGHPGRTPIGYTYKCMGAGFWALQEFDRRNRTIVPEDLAWSLFTGPLTTILRAGGDVDTNAAVAGAMLGACVGWKNIPSNLVYGLGETNINRLERSLSTLEKLHEWSSQRLA